MTSSTIERNSYNASLTLLERQGFTAATVLDVGAAEGSFFVTRHLYRLFMASKHFFVDAMQENAPVYDKLKASFGADYAITALSCVEGEVALRIDPTFYNTHLVGLQQDLYQETRKVRLTTLDALVAERNVEGPYLLKLDVQGAELDVLRGAVKTLDRCNVVVCEIQMFFERDNLTELLLFMQSRGFALFDITDQAYYPSNHVMYQCYATFIPQRLDYRKGVAWCTPEQERDTNERLRARRADTVRVLEHLAATITPVGSTPDPGGAAGV